MHRSAEKHLSAWVCVYPAHVLQRTMLRMMVSMVLFCSTLLPTQAAKKNDEISPSEPAEAYFALVRGDTARENGNLAVALAAYQDALARYERIARVHPDWESDIVQYRIVYCRQQIEEVQKQMPAGGAPKSDAAAPEQASVEMPTESVAEELDEQSEISAATPTLEADVTEVESAGPDAVEASPPQENQEVEYLRNRIAELVQQVSELEEALETQAEQGDAAQLKKQLDEAMSRAESAETKVRELEDEVKRLSRALAERQEQSKTADEPDDTEYRHLLREAMKRERAGDYRGALAIYEQARKKKGADLQAALGQARCLIALGQLDKALAFLEKQKDADKMSSIAVLRATAQGALGHYEQVVELLHPWQQSGTTDPWVYNLLGAARLALGQYEEARGLLEKAIELAPEFAEPYYNLAVWYLTATNDLAKAAELYRQSVKQGGLSEPDFERLMSSP